MRIESMLPGKAGDSDVTANNNRLFVEAVLCIALVGAPRRELPDKCGPCLCRLAKDANFEEVFLDSTLVQAHQHSAGAPINGDQALSRSLGGLITKIQSLVEGLGQLVRWTLTSEHVHDLTQAQTADRPHCHWRHRRR
jgi:hypothetical protein